VKNPIFDLPDPATNLDAIRSNGYTGYRQHWSNNRHVYVIKWTFLDESAPSYPTLEQCPAWGCKAIYKIGRSWCPEARLKRIRWSYRKETMWPGSFKIIASKAESDKLSEKSLKEEYDYCNIRHENGYEGGFDDSALIGKTEWFDLSWGITDATGPLGTFTECKETRLLSKFLVEPQGRDEKGRFLKVESESAIILKMLVNNRHDEKVQDN